MSWTYEELGTALPTLWKLLSRIEKQAARKAKGKKVHEPVTQETYYARRELRALLSKVESDAKCQHCHEIEDLERRIESLENAR